MQRGFRAKIPLLCISTFPIYIEISVVSTATHAYHNRRQFKSFTELRQKFKGVDQVGKLTVFNIGGNKVRLIAAIHYNRQKVYIRAVLTHEEYDQGKDLRINPLPVFIPALKFRGSPTKGVLRDRDVIIKRSWLNEVPIVPATSRCSTLGYPHCPPCRLSLWGTDV